MKPGIIPQCLEVLRAVCEGIPEDEDNATFQQLLQAIRPDEPAGVALQLLSNASCREEHAGQLLDMGLLDLPLLQLSLPWGSFQNKRQLLALQEVSLAS
jgi:hypothetical protein